MAKNTIGKKETIFVVPANAVHSHVNTSNEEVVLFDVTDSGLLENLGILEFKEED
jgi:gentisate 1,2-dioxygenase